MLVLIKSEHNLADDLTKLNRNGALLNVMRKGRLDHPIEDFTLRHPQKMIS